MYYFHKEETAAQRGYLTNQKIHGHWWRSWECTLGLTSEPPAPRVPAFSREEQTEAPGPGPQLPLCPRLTVGPGQALGPPWTSGFPSIHKTGRGE